MSKGGYLRLWGASLTEKHVSTRKTAHYFGNKLLPLPHRLLVVQYPGDSGYYLIYLDEDGEELTDTYHDDIHSAQEQAEWEFNIKRSDWEKVT